MPPTTRLTPAAAAALPMQAGRLSALAFSGDGVEIRHYAPQGKDLQTPHDRDEFYFVISGSGTYQREGEMAAFGPGDMLFAAAGEEHRFLDFTTDFATWVLFYGPKKV